MNLVLIVIDRGNIKSVLNAYFEIRQLRPQKRAPVSAFTGAKRM